jgi:hypothetical protein
MFEKFRKEPTLTALIALILVLTLIALIYGLDIRIEQHQGWYEDLICYRSAELLKGFCYVQAN